MSKFTKIARTILIIDLLATFVSLLLPVLFAWGDPSAGVLSRAADNLYTNTFPFLVIAVFPLAVIYYIARVVDAGKTKGKPDSAS